MDIQNVKYHILAHLERNTIRNKRHPVLDVKLVKEALSIGIEFNKAVEELLRDGFVDYFDDTFTYLSITEVGLIECDRLIREGILLDYHIIDFFLFDENRKIGITYERLQNYFIQKYEYTGIGIFSCVKDLIKRDFLECNDEEIIKDSLIKLKIL
jgi:hypothetical protein